MKNFLRKCVKALIPVCLLFPQATCLWAQAPAEFHWVNLEKDDWTIGTIRKALQSQQFTAIRDIGVLGDAALVFTSNRARPDAIPDTDVTTVYSVSLRTLFFQKIASGYQMHAVGWSNLVKDHRGELAVTYVDCLQCESSTFFTTFYFEGKSDTWQTRWMANQHGAPLSAPKNAKDYSAQLVYAIVTSPTGQESLVTWTHYDYANPKRSEDFIYQYDVDPSSYLDRVLRLSGKETTDIKLQLCQADAAWAYLLHGQDSSVCQNLLQTNTRQSRHLVTTPPRQNEGRSLPPR